MLEWRSGARHIFAPGLYWDRRRPGGLPLQATMVLVADAVGATVCRRDGGGPSRDGQQASHRENVARTRGNHSFWLAQSRELWL
jgi:hypothetical protein